MSKNLAYRLGCWWGSRGKITQMFYAIIGGFVLLMIIIAAILPKTPSQPAAQEQTLNVNEKKTASDRAWKYCEDYVKIRELDPSQKLGWMGRSAFVLECKGVKEKEFLEEIQKEVTERKASQVAGSGPAYWAIMRRDFGKSEWFVFESEERPFGDPIDYSKDSHFEVFPSASGEEGRVECRARLQDIKRRWSKGTVSSMAGQPDQLSNLCWLVRRNPRGSWPRYENLSNNSVWTPKDPSKVGSDEALRWAEEGSQAKGNWKPPAPQPQPLTQAQIHSRDCHAWADAWVRRMERQLTPVFGAAAGGGDMSDAQRKQKIQEAYEICVKNPSFLEK